MEFGIVQLQKFNAENGSYSLVTSRELYDSQITATDAETDLLRNYFLRRGEDIYVGNVGSSQGKSLKEFKLYPSGEIIKLNLVYPKPQKGELRLYISKRAGFFPNEGDVWFMFISHNDKSLWIGTMPEKQWRLENSIGKQDDEFPSTDKIDAEIIDSAKPIKENDDSDNDNDNENITNKDDIKEKDISIRRREIAVLRMMKSKYKCEYDSTHSLFIAKATGCPYLEVHHIIPMCFQKSLHGLKLDSINNLCCLCPNCHRAIHHAEDDVVKEILNTVAYKRNIELNFKLNINDLYRLYSVEEIVR